MILFRSFSSNKSKSVDLYDHLSEILSKMDNYLWSKESTLKPFSKGVVPKKPIWAGKNDTLIFRFNLIIKLL